MKHLDLRVIAEKALSTYDIQVGHLQLFSEDAATIFIVLSSDQQKYALKIYENQSSSFQDNQVELYLMERIQQDGRVAIADLLYNRQGQSLVSIKDEHSGQTFRLALFKWLEGKALKGNESKEKIQVLGKALACMHAATEQAEIPPDILPRRWNQVFYYRDETPIYHLPAYSQELEESQIAMLDRVIPQLNDRLAAIYTRKEKPQLIHADVNPWNVRFGADGLSILDFEDAILGFPLHDLAILLYYYRNEPSLSYPEVKEYLYTGYQNMRALPDHTEEDLEWLWMARKVNFVNYVLSLEEDYQEFLTQAFIEIAAFENKYLA